MKRSWGLWMMIIVLLLLVYVFFYQPQIFQHIFNYPGPGSPFINTP